MAGNLSEVSLGPAICAGEGCLADAAPGNVFCWRCIRKRSRPVKDYQAKVERYAESRASKMQARMRPRLYAVAVGSAVKFGITVNVQDRMSGLQTALPQQLVLIGHVGCDRQLERDVHQVCAEQSIRGEWFRREGVVLFVEQCIAENNVIELYRKVGRMPDWLKN